nr:helix-turn-helix transcriptional regulator [Ohessyouella blattaphilus]
MCEYLNISTSHFSTIFKEETGKTFLEALNGVRMEKAKQLLRETSLKNYQIAEKVGFSDPHYFNIAFKKIVGMTPKHYAKEHRQ